MIAALIPLFFLELFVSMWVGEKIGFSSSALWIVATILTGTMLLKNTPNTLMRDIMSAQLGKLDTKSANNASMSYILGAVTLIVPGVISDSIGVLLLGYSIYLRILAKIKPQKQNYTNSNQGDTNVIDVEIIDD